MASKKILIVYLSRTNNTKTIAKIIQKNVGGKLVALELQKPYPENYHANCATGSKGKRNWLFAAAKNKNRQHRKL